MEQHHLALLFDTFTERVTERRKFCAYEQGLFELCLESELVGFIQKSSLCRYFAED